MLTVKISIVSFSELDERFKKVKKFGFKEESIGHTPDSDTTKYYVATVASDDYILDTDDIMRIFNLNLTDYYECAKRNIKYNRLIVDDLTLHSYKGKPTFKNLEMAQSFFEFLNAKHDNAELV